MKVIPCYLVLLMMVCFWLVLPAQEQNQEPIIKKINEHIYKLQEMTIDTEKQTVSIPCNVNMSSGLIEVVLCRPEGKVHESLLTTQITPLEFQTALLLLGLDPVNELSDDPNHRNEEKPFKTIETPGDSVKIFLETNASGKTKKEPLENFIYNEKHKRPLQRSTWLFRGAVTMADDMILLEPEVSMIVTYHDPVALMELNSGTKYDDELYYVNSRSGLNVKDKVNLIIQRN